MWGSSTEIRCDPRMIFFHLFYISENPAKTIKWIKSYQKEDRIIICCLDCSPKKKARESPDEVWACIEAGPIFHTITFELF